MRPSVFVLAMVLLPGFANGAAERYTIDPSHTYPHFEISHLGFSTLRGRFNSTTGSLTVDWEKKTGAVEVVIAADSVDTGFKKRDDHLRSPDFLNAAEFPEITFKSTEIKIADDGKSATVKGDLTITGVTRPVTLEVARIHCGVNPINKKQTCGFDATTRIKRSDFGVTYGLPGVGDDMALLLEVEAVKQ